MTAGQDQPPLPKISPLATLLSDNGLSEQAPTLIEPHRNQRGLWRIKFNYEDSEALSIDTTQARMLATHLRHIDQIELADELEGAVQQAERYRTM
jgi:hypothetical protein